ncbi:MAG TPA: replication initiator [Streptosporangiaceae bacterium]|nr:replication initiator [Streptosporangiaceae bacterium]HVB44635.1 replication initiator [Streptosporangiaceae bacterium]
MTLRTTRAQRLAMPLARDVIRDLAAEHGGCVRPVQLRRTDLDTGHVEQVLVPCGHTLATVCPSCAERAKTLRAAQCREGWHLDTEPVITPDPADDEQRMWVEHRAETQQHRDQADAAGDDTGDLDELSAELDEEITRSGIRGNVLPHRMARRHRSTRRRQDAPDLPRRPVTPTTIGKTYTAPDGAIFRPSMFLTLTCDSYGKVNADGTPAGLDSYDYQRAARDALHFAALFDRLIQNLRRFLGYDLQYFAAVEPQKRLAPHVHVAIRSTVSRAELRQVLAATYHQVWWPPADEIRHDDAHLPVWHEASARYLDPATGEFLPTWDEALDAIGDDDEPLHVARFGPRFDAQGVLAGSRDSARCIGYLTKYLTKQIADCHQAQTGAQAAHAGRLADALRYEPCSPTCSNWLRYGVQPKNAREGLRPGRCSGKAHCREYLGYAGRRVLVSRKWSGKTLADHRADRKAWLLETLGITDTDPARYTWEPVTPGDPDHMPPAQRLLHVVADRQRWHAALTLARARASGQGTAPDLSATGRPA